MKKFEVILIVAVIALSVTVLVQITDGKVFNEISQATVQGPPGPQGPAGPPGPQGPPGTSSQTDSSGIIISNTPANIFKKVDNSVVQITSKVSTVDNSIIINGQPLQDQSTRLGSGFIYDKDGRIITNNHVVDGSKTVNVSFVDGNMYAAKVIGTDPGNDIAVIQITDNFSDEPLNPLTLGNSSALDVGQQVIAIGNPFGLSDSMTTGIVSQVGRLLPNDNAAGFSIPDVIQVDAPINPGNSGGPLLDLNGQVVGMNTAIKTSTGDFAGVGFAVPSNAIKKIVPILISNGTYSHPYLGISGRSLDPDISLMNGLTRNFKGVLIESVVKGGPAEKAGITPATPDQNGIPHGGDIITAIDGHQVKTIYDVIVYLDEQKNVGDKVTLSVNRQGKSIDLTAILDARPSSSPTS